MSYADSLTELHGLPVFDFPRPDEEPRLPEPDAAAWRVSYNPYLESGEIFEERFERFLSTVGASRVRALIIGQWGEVYDKDAGVIVDLLVAAKDRLTSLEAVFIGDLTAEDAEISWIQQSDVTPVLDAYPGLRELGIRGGSGLRFPAAEHQNLRRLRFETGGLPGEVVRGVADSELPALEYLEMWFGVEDYGGDATVGDLAPLLSGGRFPALRHLGLQNSEIQDEIAAAVASAPVVAQLASLDLSMGVLTDEGAAALLDGQPLTHLRRLDLDHNYFSASMEQRLRDALEPSGVEVALSEKGDEDEYDGEVDRYTAVAE
ncbi:STM4015 family protein [Streptomyces botrytidirepellens]|uniref:Leucine-rich repeat domain-containing protein n=1 Tax=Streptomyces botrytidirepellens TaxID=2486417 RepID=A0A3M8SSY4_9ACTN|nr:STM4015 family protein [Streptomyces botrytidirepellens]RNF81970.1 leucine-rich repeat domain-containing protein [Streptomyces botrytidirepellens]